MTHEMKLLQRRQKMSAKKKKRLKKLLGSELRAARLERPDHLSMEQVASLLSDKPVVETYQQYELGLLEPSGMTLLELADILDLDLKALQRRFRRERGEGRPALRAARRAA